MIFEFLFLLFGLQVVEMLCFVYMVIVDEIYVFVLSKCGCYLVVLFECLSEICDEELQCIGLLVIVCLVEIVVGFFGGDCLVEIVDVSELVYVEFEIVVLVEDMDDLFLVVFVVIECLGGLILVLLFEEMQCEEGWCGFEVFGIWLLIYLCFFDVLFLYQLMIVFVNSCSFCECFVN